LISEDEVLISTKLSIDKITVLAIMIPMVALLLVGYISYESTIQFVQRYAVYRINSINQMLNNIIYTITNAETGHGGYITT
jgi:hypothetical protein